MNLQSNISGIKNKSLGVVLLKRYQNLVIGTAQALTMFSMIDFTYSKPFCLFPIST